MLATAVGIAMALNLWETRGQIFFEDEWSRFLYNTDSLESLLRGFTGHLVVVHTLLYKTLFTVFGASYLPFRIVEALLLGACGLLFYTLARSRARPWPCVATTVVLLFLGSAFEVTATPYGIVILLPMALGLAALVSLDRFRHRGDPLTCLLLTAAVAAHSDGLAFLAGATVMLCLQSGRRLWARIWVVIVPALLYVTWFVWYRITASSARAPEVVHPGHFSEIPSTAAAAAAAGLSAISGFFGSSGYGTGAPFNIEAGYLLLGLLVVVAIWRVRSGSPPAREIWVPVAIALTFWALIGTVSSFQRPPTTSRYIFPSAVFLLLILLELTRGIRPTPRVIWFTLGALLVSVIPNVINLNEQAREIRAFAATERAALGAVGLLQTEVPAVSPPDLVRTRVLGVEGQGFLVGGHPGVQVAAARYFQVVHRFSSPGASPQEIASGAEGQRRTADEILLRGHDLTLSDLKPGSVSGRGCRPAPGPADGRGPVFMVPVAGLELRPRRSRSDVNVAARRFATGFRQLTVPPGSGPMLLKPGASQQVRPWLARISGTTVCVVQ